MAPRMTCSPRSTPPRPTCPSDLPSPPYYRKFNPAEAPIMTLALTSDTLSTAQVYDAADTILGQRLAAGGRREPGQHRRRREARGAHPAQPGGARRDRARRAGRVQRRALGQCHAAHRAASKGRSARESIGVNGQMSQASEYCRADPQIGEWRASSASATSPTWSTASPARGSPRGTATSPRSCSPSPSRPART